MKKLSAILIIFVLSYVPAYADEVIQQISRQVVASEFTAGNFRQEKRLKFLRKPLISEGRFIYSRAQGVVWLTLAPVASSLFINDKRLLVDNAEQGLPPQFGRIFQALLSGNLAQLAEDFSIQAVQGKTDWHLELTPKQDVLKKLIQRIQLAGDTDVRSLMVEESGGNTTSIAFSAINHPQRLNSEQLADFARFSP